MGTMSLKPPKKFPYTWYFQRYDGTVVFTKVYVEDKLRDTIVKKVYREGPKGGVKVIFDDGQSADHGYITQQPEKMKEFMWVKLSAQ